MENSFGVLWVTSVAGVCQKGCFKLFVRGVSFFGKEQQPKSLGNVLYYLCSPICGLETSVDFLALRLAV